jgi:hypothetical protein
LEYFCAWEFVWQFKELQTLTIEQLINDVFGNHWQDESWHEVLRLISGMIEPRFVAEIIDFLLEQKVDESKFFYEDEGGLRKEGLSNFLLAANCLEEVRHRDWIAANTSNKLLKVLQHKFEQEFLDYETRYIVIRIIATIWKENPSVFAWFKNFIGDVSYLTGIDFYIVVAQIVETWKGDPDIFLCLKDRALNDRDNDVRSFVVRAIAQGWKDDPDTLSWLKDCALNDEDNDVRSAAVQEIAQGWKEDPQTFDFLCDRAIHDPFVRGNEYQPNPRQTALQAILNHYRDKPQTLELLKAISNNDPDEELKEFAKEELAKLSENSVGA